jgi:hypothetical protein
MGGLVPYVAILKLWATTILNSLDTSISLLCIPHVSYQLFFIRYVLSFDHSRIYIYGVSLGIAHGVMNKLLSIHFYNGNAKIVRALLLHLITAPHIIIAIAILTLRNIDRIKPNIMIGAEVRITYDVELKRVCAFRQRELELDQQAFVHRDALDDEELPRGGLADDQPPIRHLFRRVEGRDDELVVHHVLFVRIAGQRHLQDDRTAGGVLALDKVVRDFQCRVRVDKGGDISPGIEVRTVTA